MAKTKPLKRKKKSKGQPTHFSHLTFPILLFYQGTFPYNT